MHRKETYDTMASPNPTARTLRIRPLSAVIVALAAATALVHLQLGVVTHMLVVQQPALAAQLAAGGPPLSLMAALFYLNCAGYLTLLVALYLPGLRRFRPTTRWLLVAFTAVTIVAYFALARGHYDLFGNADKVVEGLLIALLIVEGRRGG
jgi:hypothetical protein